MSDQFARVAWNGQGGVTTKKIMRAWTGEWLRRLHRTAYVNRWISDASCLHIRAAFGFRDSDAQCRDQRQFASIDKWQLQFSQHVNAHSEQVRWRVCNQSIEVADDIGEGITHTFDTTVNVATWISQALGTSRRVRLVASSQARDFVLHVGTLP